MRSSSPLLHLTAVLASLRSVSAGVGFDCSSLVSDKITWDLSPLAGPKTVHWVRSEPPSTTTTTFTIDLCAPLKRDKDIPKDEQCESGTRICGVEQIVRQEEGNSTRVIDKVIPIAGEYTATHGRHLESWLTRLRSSGSNADSELEGVRVELSGSRYPLSGKSGVEQRAVIEFICDPDVTGNEGFEEGEQGEGEEEDGEKSRREEGDDEDDELPDLDRGKSLQFKSYREQPDGDTWVLRLEWRTKYACENARDLTPPSKQGGWGFFTWFIIVLFLSVATYLIFGSWLNYNRYGARGWDLLPHGDTIRDIPYIMGDWGRRVVSTVQGSGSRGGYSAL